MEIRDLTPEIVAHLLPSRSESSAKWDYGRLLVVAGHASMPGAALLCVGAAARSGVGLVRLASVKAVCLTVAAHLAECTYAIMPSCPGDGISAAALPVLLGEAKPCAAVVLGPGLGRGEAAEALVHGLVSGCARPLVVDADGLYFLTPQSLQALGATGLPPILTPHVHELARLSGHSAAALLQDPARHAAAFAQKNRVTLVLKGPETFIASPFGGPVWRHSLPNSGLAKGGSGDVLAGLAGGLLAQLAAAQSLGAQGVRGPGEWDLTLRAALCAVWLHGRAGQLARQQQGPYAMTPGGVIGQLAGAFMAIPGQK